MKKLLTLFALLAFAVPAHAGFVDFDAGLGSPGSNMGNFTYGGGGGPLTALGVPIISVTGLGTTIDSGVVHTISNGSLDFTTGNYLNDDGGKGWTFDKGGSIVITGSISGINSFVTQLFSGTFTQQTTIIDEGDDFRVLGGGFRGTLNSDLANHYGLDGSSVYSGSLAMLFSSSSIPGGAISNTTLTSGNVGIDTVPFSGIGPTVPEPASVAMLGIGLAGVGLYSRNRKRAA